MTAAEWLGTVLGAMWVFGTMWLWYRESIGEGSPNPFEAGDDAVTGGGSIPLLSGEWCAGGGSWGPGDRWSHDEFDFESAGSEARWRKVLQEPFTGSKRPGSDHVPTP